MLSVRFVALFLVLGSVLAWDHFAQELYCHHSIVARVEMLSMEKAQRNPKLQTGLENTPRWMTNLPIRILEVYRDTISGSSNLKKHKGSEHVAYTKVDNQLDAFDYDNDYDNIVGRQYLTYFNDWDKIILGSSVTRWCKVGESCTENRQVSSFHRHFLHEGGFDCTCLPIDNCYNRNSGREEVPDCIEYRHEEGSVACARDLKTKVCVWKGSKRTCVNPNWSGRQIQRINRRMV